MGTDRSKQPEIKVPETVFVPDTMEHRSANNIPLHIINIQDTQDIIRVSLVFRAGTRFQDYPFQSSSVVNLLKEGTKKYSSAEISGMIDFYGMYYDVSIDRDFTIVSVSTLARFIHNALDMLAEVTAAPAFTEEELKIYSAKRKQDLTIEREKVSFVARELFGKLLFGENHPYGVTSPAEMYDCLTSAKLHEFHKNHYVSGNCFAVVSGKLNDSTINKILGFLEYLPDGSKAPFGELKITSGPESGFINKEDAVQSAIRIGKVLFNRNHPDFIGMQVLNTVLGGYFGSRLISNLREDKGYTYGIYSTMVNLEATGYMAIATEVGAEFTDDAVREIYNEIDRLRTEPIPENELNAVKNILTGEYLRIIDGPFGIADVTIENIQNGKDNGYVNYSLGRIKSITSKELLELAGKYLTPGSFTEAIVGKKG